MSLYRVLLSHIQALEGKIPESASSAKQCHWPYFLFCLPRIYPGVLVCVHTNCTDKMFQTVHRTCTDTGSVFNLHWKCAACFTLSALQRLVRDIWLKQKQEIQFLNSICFVRQWVKCYTLYIISLYCNYQV